MALNEIDDPDAIGAIKIKDGLFIGDEMAAQDLEFVVANKVTRVINCAASQIPNHWEPIGVIYLHFNWSDEGKLINNMKNTTEEIYEFIEETLFSRISQILAEASSAGVRCEKILKLLLTFCERNPGITRILTGDPLAGETERLRIRVNQLFERIETQLKQVLREMPMRGEGELAADPSAAANLLLSTVEGRISQYVRSDFEKRPTENWNEQWKLLMQVLATRG